MDNNLCLLPAVLCVISLLEKEIQFKYFGDVNGIFYCTLIPFDFKYFLECHATVHGVTQRVWLNKRMQLSYPPAQNFMKFFAWVGGGWIVTFIAGRSSHQDIGKLGTFLYVCSMLTSLRANMLLATEATLQHENHSSRNLLGAGSFAALCLPVCGLVLV